MKEEGKAERVNLTETPEQRAAMEGHPDPVPAVKVKDWWKRAHAHSGADPFAVTVRHGSAVHKGIVQHHQVTDAVKYANGSEVVRGRSFVLQITSNGEYLLASYTNPDDSWYDFCCHVKVMDETPEMFKGRVQFMAGEDAGPLRTNGYVAGNWQEVQRDHNV